MSDQSFNLASMNPSLQAVHDSMMQGLGQLADYFGYNRVMGELYASLLLNPNPMSLDDLKEAVRKSKASVSMNTRKLEYMGAVKEVWVREDNPSNRKFYEAEGDFWKILQKLFDDRELKNVEIAIAVMQDSIENLQAQKDQMDAENRALTDFYIDRLERLIAFFKFARLVITTIMEKASEMDISEITKITVE